MSEIENVINALRTNLNDDNVQFVKMYGEIVFSKVILPDGRCAWAVPNDRELLHQKIRATLKEGVTR